MSGLVWRMHARPPPSVWLKIPGGSILALTQQRGALGWKTTFACSVSAGVPARDASDLWCGAFGHDKNCTTTNAAVLVLKVAVIYASLMLS